MPGVQAGALLATLTAAAGVLCTQQAVIKPAPATISLSNQEHPPRAHPVEEFITRWAGPYYRKQREDGTDWTLAGPAAGLDPPSSRLPVILIPPLTGSTLYAHLNKPSHSPHFWCERTSPGWEKLWLSPHALLPGIFPCFAENLKSVIDPTTNRSHGVPGVTTRVGSGDDIGEGLNPLLPVKQQLQQLGWDVNKEVHTHAYDWRLSPVDWSAPDQEAGWATLKQEIEALSEANGGKPVVAVGLSMGASYFSTMLSSGYVDQAWKRKYVAAQFSISGVFGGTPVAIWDTISARLQGLERLYGRDDVLNLLRAVPALYWMAPQPQAYSDLTILVNTALKRQYSAAQVGEALQQAGASNGATWWSQSMQYSPAQPPGVKTYCLYSRGFPTAQTVTYHSADFSDAGSVAYTDGDITVPLQGLAACQAWSNVPDHPPVISKVWWFVMHAGILMREDGMQFFLEELTKMSNGHADASKAAQ